MSATASKTAPGPERTDGRGPRLWFVGALPPPLHGQSNYNRAMLDHLVERGTPVRLQDTGGTGIVKLARTLRALLTLLVRARSRDRAYLSVPGQNGVWLFALIALGLRLRGIAHFVHHHSFRPINCAPSRAIQTLVAWGGPKQRHILLSDGMRRRFSELYLGIEPGRALALSNAYLFGPSSLGNAARPDRVVTLGHLSVLTREKGVSYLLALFADLAARGHDWRLVIAGPCASPELAAEVAAAVAAYPQQVEYRGAVSGEEKERFFADIDLFVLPTTLIDEAEPLVMLEAYGRGIDVVASDTGCISDRIRTPDHLLALDRHTDVLRLEGHVRALAADWNAARNTCVEHATGIKALADADAAAFFPELLRPWGAVATGPPAVT